MPSDRTVAALFVQRNGCYWDLPGVEPWDEAADARTYAGPHPVVCHPPCERWGNYWPGSPGSQRRLLKGNDGGCFAHALWSARTFGGLIEHPRGSRAWDWFGLPVPRYGFTDGDNFSGFSVELDQWDYGHRAIKGTWLYIVASNPLEVAALVRDHRMHQQSHPIPVERMSKRERASTPVGFRNLLLAIVRAHEVEW